VPGVNTQGETLEEARKNLREALRLVLETNREIAREQSAGREVIREPFALAS
jgi:predicted RNase H-like HicB family nuclease